MKNLIRLAPGISFGIILLLSFTSTSFCQNSQQTDEKTIIESDSIQITVSGNKADLIQFVFKRKLKVRINSEEGIDAFSRIEIPDNYDPILHIHSPEARNTGKYLTKIDISNFSVKITKPDGNIISPEMIPEPEFFRSVNITDEKFGEYENYNFNIPDIGIRDELDVEYTYSVLYSENIFSLMTFRVFFHGNFPILIKDFVFTREKGLDTEVNPFFCEPTDISKGNRISYSLHLENLDACMHESGIRPYDTLPHIIISIRPDEMVYTIPYTYEETYIPFYVFGASIREERHLTIAKAMVYGTNNNQYNQVRRFIETRINNIGDDETGYAQLYNVHNYIAENFEFDQDLEYFDRLDVRDELLGDYITKEVIRDRSRYNIYVALITGLDLNYFTAYLADKRTGIISNEYFEPTITNDNLFAILLKNDNIQFLYPKKERFGYYLNELPFYFEDVPVRLIYLDDFRDYKKAMNPGFRSVNTPSSNSNDNVRTQSASVWVDLDNMSLSFNASISLAGQFSTLGRGAYLYNTCDPSVNPLYCIKFWDGISPEIVPESFETKSLDKDFPFKAGFTASFTTEGPLDRVNDTIILDLSGWFNHIIDDKLDADHRILAYYPDFKYTDSYNYQLVFSKKVKVIDRLPILEINNAYAQLVLKCIQKIDGTLLLSSRIIVTAEKINPDQITMVKEIQDQLKNMNHLKVRMVEVE